jgi:hypothetical protein
MKLIQIVPLAPEPAGTMTAALTHEVNPDSAASPEPELFLMLTTHQTRRPVRQEVT